MASPSPGPAALAESPEWQHVMAVWAEAEDICFWRRGSYPFDEAGKRRVLDDLAQASREVDALRQRGLVSKAEAGLLGIDLEELANGVRAMRPTELANATCYVPAYFDPVQASVDRLSRRLPLLEKLAGGACQPIVLRKVLFAVESELASLSDPRRPESSNVSEAEATDLREKMKSIPAKLKPTQPGGSEQNPTGLWGKLKEVFGNRRRKDTI